MKRFHLICLFLVQVCMLSCLTACGGNPESSTPVGSEPDATAPSVQELTYTLRAFRRVSETMVMGEAVQNVISWEILHTPQAAEAADVWLTVDAEAFFAEKALILTYLEAASPDMRLTMDQATVQGGTLTLHYTAKRPYEVTDRLACWHVLLEVDREALDGVNKVVGEETLVQLTQPPREIAYTVRDQVDGGMDGWWIVRSREDLLATKLDTSTFYKGKDYAYKIDLSPYTNAYFEERALLWLGIGVSGSERVQVERLLVDDELMTVEYTVVSSSSVNIDVASSSCVLLEVDPADVEKVTKLAFNCTSS